MQRSGYALNAHTIPHNYNVLTEFAENMSKKSFHKTETVREIFFFHISQR